MAAMPQFTPATTYNGNMIRKEAVVSVNLLKKLKEEKESRTKGGIYHKMQIELTYNSNHLEGSRLSHDQTRYIFDTNTVAPEKDGQSINVDDIVETVNHFRCIDMVIDYAEADLSEAFIKGLHKILKTGTSDSNKSWFRVGEYKSLPNEVSGVETTPPEDVSMMMSKLLDSWNKRAGCGLEDILDFHHAFERIHPFQDGNGRIGRLIMFKECLKNDIVPFIITDDLKYFYYKGLKEWRNERGFLRDTCLTAQDRFKQYLKYFRI